MEHMSVSLATIPGTQTSSSETSPRLRPIDAKADEAMELESGYGSTTSSTASLPQISLTTFHLKHINEQLEGMQAVDILRFCRTLFPNLYQTTAFGLTGLVTIDMLSRIERETLGSSAVDLIFLDTLYHFPETYRLVEKVKGRYANIKVHTYRPEGADTVVQFEAMYGERLYDVSPETYDWFAKVEPQQRAYAELNVAAVLTGRRRSQGGQRDRIPIVEVDEERGMVKINPLVNWSFQDVKRYIEENNVPYNELLDRGYKSVGDWHSTSPVSEGEDERAGRWKGQDKTECGIHNKQSRYAQFLKQQSLQPLQSGGEANEQPSSSPTTDDQEADPLQVKTIGNAVAVAVAAAAETTVEAEAKAVVVAETVETVEEALYRAPAALVPAEPKRAVVGKLIADLAFQVTALPGREGSDPSSSPSPSLSYAPDSEASTSDSSTDWSAKKEECEEVAEEWYQLAAVGSPSVPQPRPLPRSDGPGLASPLSPPRPFLSPKQRVIDSTQPDPQATPLSSVEASPAFLSRAERV